MLSNEAKNQIDTLIFSLERSAILAKRPDGKFINRQELRLKANLKRSWKKQMDYVVEHAKGLSIFTNNAVKINALEDEVFGLLSGLPEKKEIIESIILSMRLSLERGGKTAVKQLKLSDFGISFDIKNKKAIEFLDAKRTLELSNYKGNIDATTKQNISRILLDAANSGQSYQKTAQQIMAQGEAGVFSQARGQLIATHEIGVAYETGNRIPIDEFQKENPDRPVQKYWQTVEDDRVTPECAANEDEGWIELDKPFPSSDQNAPRYGNPRCRCFTKYQIT